MKPLLPGSLLTLRAAARTLVFVLKVLPTLPSRPLDFVTPRPIVEWLEYPTLAGTSTCDVYRPSASGPHPVAVVCLGVVPFGVDHPQVPRLGEALARSGFAALLYWSPHMRDYRLDPEDIDNIALAYERLLAQPYADPGRGGLIGTCVGASFALMAAAHPRINQRVTFVGAFAPYGSLLTLACDIAGASCLKDGARGPWAVDPLTRKVFVHSVTALLDSEEASLLRAALESEEGRPAPLVETLSPDAKAVHAFLNAHDIAEAQAALERLPCGLREGLRALSPLTYIDGIKAPRVAISHDRDDVVIPAQESRTLFSAFPGREGVTLTEFAMFQHADPTKRKLSPPRLAWQLSKFYLWLYALFRASA